MESTAQCDWEGGFLQCPSNEGQRPQWEAIKPLVLNLQTTGKTSPCVGREREKRERKEGGDAILPRDSVWKPHQQCSLGTHINWPFHQFPPVLYHLPKGNTVCHVPNTTRKPLSSNRTWNCDSQCFQGHVQGRFVVRLCRWSRVD